MNAQLKKGILDMLVLAQIDSVDRYGFELVERISRHVEIAERTIYPLLKRLRDDKLVTTYLRESDQGAPRKYYRITKAGRRYLEDARVAWGEIRDGVDALLEDNDEQE